MSTITIVLTNLPKGRGVSVQTDAGAPAIGQVCNPAQALAMDLLRICKAQADAVHYGQPCATFAGDLLAAQSAQ